MKPRTLLLVTATLYLISGSSALLAPARQLALYGVAAGPGEAYMAQWAGLGSLAIGLLAWFGRNVTDFAALRAILLTMLFYYVIAGVISMLGTLSGVMTPVGWLLVLVNALFVLGYAYCLRRSRPSDRPTGA